MKQYKYTLIKDKDIALLINADNLDEANKIFTEIVAERYKWEIPLSAEYEPVKI